MKKGSALLIVLGMLAFMVISAVAFSAFMRYSRLPSSYLRRTSSSRHLVKAALAEAIDIVDASIADNPHPGVGFGTISYPRDGDNRPSADRDNTRNQWRNHVFTGSRRLVAAEDTVSTLTLEGLAYLPPALINEARYYSRHSTAAAWQTFGYDCGRFAFCAVDVSDHLNVNKIPADVGRGSSPENRLSLAYVFDRAGDVSPGDWDGFMEHYVKFGVKNSLMTPAQRSAGSAAGGASPTVPLVSLADLNLALVENGGSFVKYFPFVDYLAGTAGELVRYPYGTQQAEAIRSMAFVTDGYFPSAAGSSDDDDYDLSDNKFQPFPGDKLNSDNDKVDMKSIMTKSEPGALRLRNRIGGLGLVHLWDYLDENNVPVSLAIPSVERTPMVCGIKPKVDNLSVKINVSVEDPAGSKIDATKLRETITADGYAGASKAGKPSGPEDTRTATYVKKYVLDKQKFFGAIRGGAVKAVVTYPFRRGIDLKDPDSFTIDGHVEFFFTTGDFKFRTGNQGDLLHFENVHQNDNVFSKAQEYKGKGVLHVTLASTDCTFNNSAKPGYDEDKAVQEIDNLIMGPGASEVGTAIDNYPVFTVTYEQTERAEPYMVGDKEEYRWFVREDDVPSISKAECGLPPLGANGEIDPDFADKDKVKNYLSGNAEKQATLRMAVYLRIKNGDGKTVDLVPACAKDDEHFNDIRNYQAMGPILDGSLGNSYPVMRFTFGTAFAFSAKAFDKMTGEIAADVEPKGVMCADPRWNWAPEHWFKYDDVSKDKWLQDCGKGVDGRDRDIFMATSEAGYLQSVYELAFLPRLAGNFNPENDFWGSLVNPDDERADWATGFGGVRNSGLMWRTYRPYAYGDGDNERRDPFEDVGFVPDGNGPRVNPYAGSVIDDPASGDLKSVDASPLMAAFANPPESWWSASANTEAGLSADERKAETFNKKYAFSSKNNDAKLDWYDFVTKSGDEQQVDDLPVAENFCYRLWAAVRGNGGGLWNIDKWKDVYNDLWKEGEMESDRDKWLMGAKLEESTATFYGVDRKFLYGYWRDSLDVKQQLFLIFVRAEPMMMGGGAIGQTPPQLGARAVALVWRNPYPGSKPYWPDNAATLHSENAPHQTRVLMYRQFD